MFIKISKTIMGSLMLFSLDRLVTKNQIYNTKYITPNVKLKVYSVFSIKKRKKEDNLASKHWHTQ